MAMIYLDESYPFNERGTQPSKVEVLNRLQDYYDRALVLMKQQADSEVLNKAKQLKKELGDEYSRLNLCRVEDNYRTNPWFMIYKHALCDAECKTSGPLSYKKLNSFFYDVQSYCGMAIEEIKSKD